MVQQHRRASDHNVQPFKDTHIMATTNRSGRITSAHPPQRGEPQTPTAGAVELEPLPDLAWDAISEIEDVASRLNSLLIVVEYAVNARRVLDALKDKERFDPTFKQALSDACSTWLDPDTHGETPAALVHLLSMSREDLRKVQANTELLTQLRVQGAAA